MRTLTYDRLLQWSECDPAGIMFFPHYARWMVEGVNLLFLGLGIDPNAKTVTGQLGLPSTGFTTQFHSPAFLHDRLTHEVSVAKIGTKSLTFEHRFLRADVCVADAIETRIWVETTPDGMRSQPIPDDVRATLERDAPVQHPLDERADKPERISHVEP